MIRVEFRLSMPSRGSWDNKWSGEKKNYTIVRELDDSEAARLVNKSWAYSWDDGWRAQVSARLLRDGEELRPSDGFEGYDWMVASILRYGKIYASHELPETSP